MENKSEIFCSNHSNKGAKKHCGQCNLDLCNECALDLHIDHYKSLEKIENCIKNKYLIYKEALDQEIKNILNNTADDISLKVYNNVQEKALKNYNEYKNNDDNKPILLNVLRTHIGGGKGKEKEESSVKINDAASELKGDNINKKEEKKSPVEEKQPSENKEKETTKTEIKVEEEKKLVEKEKEEKKEENKDKIESEKNNEEENKNNNSFIKEDLESDKSKNSESSDKSEKSEKSEKSDNESNSASEDEDKKEEKDDDFRSSMITKKNVKNNLLGNMLAKPQEDDKEKKKAVHFKEDEHEIKNVEKKIEMVENLMDTGEEDQLKKKNNYSKRNSVGVVEFSSFRKRQFKSGKIEVSSLYEIKEEYVDEKKEKEEPDSSTRPNIIISDKAKEMRRMKTDGVLPSVGGGLSAAEDRKNRLAKRLNKAKQVAKNKENANKYRKSVDITMKASLLALQLNIQKEENK